MILFLIRELQKIFHVRDAITFKCAINKNYHETCNPHIQ